MDERERATAVVTALLNGDHDLAEQLVRDDDDPFGLAFGASTITAGLWDHHCRQMGINPSDAWAQSLVALKQRRSE